MRLREKRRGGAARRGGTAQPGKTPRREAPQGRARRA
jgi:hypothetical protein